MALPMAAARGPLWRLGPAALSPARGRIPPPLAPAVSRSPVRSLSSRAASRALVAAVAGAARRVSARYERYLERSWPRFFLLHSTFKNGPGAGGAGDPQDPGQDGRAAAEPSAAPVPGHGAAAAVPQGRAQGHSHRDHRHPPLRQLPGAAAHVFLPPAAPDPALLDAQAAAGVPGRVRPPAQGLARGRAAGAGAGSALPARGAAPAAPAAALPAGAGRGPAPAGAAPGSQEFVLGLSAAPQQAPGGSRESPEPGAVPDPSPAGLRPAAPPAQPRPGDPAAGRGPAAPGAGAALRGGAAGGLLPAWAELHPPGPGAVPGVAGAVAQALLPAPSLGGLSAGTQHGAAGPGAVPAPEGPPCVTGG
ncbi:LETM1 domain-containing protein 1 isoform X4 [Zonotrichia leucophrys gambelii]|uniref:LETM1 domain-containing protein 1 isoform X4 n=1 Tax=Zonotrichia leucophrys gambelii TaxID=257770 RepID=UPI003140B68E